MFQNKIEAQFRLMVSRLHVTTIISLTPSLDLHLYEPHMYVFSCLHTRHLLPQVHTSDRKIYELPPPLDTDRWMKHFSDSLDLILPEKARKHGFAALLVTKKLMHIAHKYIYFL